MAPQPKSVWLFTVRHPNGQPLCTLLVESVPANGDAATSPAEAPSPGRPGTAPASGDGEPKMTEPQRRFLFRLLAGQKVEGQAAEEHLKGYFKVRNLGEITKAGASAYINQLVEDRKDAGQAS